jgi:hypothetical protein
MDIELQVKTDDDGNQCHDGTCNARYKVRSAEGGYVIIGKVLSGADTAGLPIGDGEGAFWVPDPIIDQRS